MAKGPVDQDLANAYKRHGGPLKAWKYFGKSRLDKAKTKGKDMVNYFKDKMKEKGTVRYDRAEYLKSQGKDVSKTIRKTLNKDRMKKQTTQPLKGKRRMPLKTIKSMPLKESKASLKKVIRRKRGL